MLEDLMAESKKFGLEVHESKTKFLWNGSGPAAQTEKTTVRQRQFEVLGAEGATMYLGKLFSFTDTHDVE